MNHSYKNKFEILKTFKEDKYQTVLIGCNKENLNQVVVINIIHKDKISNTISKSQFSDCLSNVIYLEDTEEDLVIVTEYNEGTPLESYLNFFNKTTKHKINLAYEYMTKITKYDVFENSIKRILIDESQIMISDENIYFNELLFFDENFSNSIEFNDISSKLGEIIEKIVFSNKTIENRSTNQTSERILKFIEKLKNNDHNFENIEDIYNFFRKIYIYDDFMENEYRLDDKDKIASQIDSKIPQGEHLNTEAIGYHETEKNTDPNILKNDNMNNENKSNINSNEILIGNEEISDAPTSHNKSKKTRRFYIRSIAIGILLLIILLYGSIHMPVFNASSSEAPKLEAHFIYEKIADSYQVTNDSTIYGKDNEIIETSWKIYKDDNLIREINKNKSLNITFEDEGNYRIVLSVKDKYDNVDNYTEEIIYNKMTVDDFKNNIASEEKLDTLNPSYSDNTVTKDYETFRSGSYSLKIGEEDKTNSEKIVVDNLKIQDHPIISMWIQSASKEEIHISVKGYKDDNLVFSKSISFIPQKPNIWEMVNLSEATKNINKIELIFSNFTSPIWLDDIAINAYK